MMKNSKVYVYILIYIATLLKGQRKKAKILFAQAWHETAGFTSAIYNTNNNMFGMKLPTIRRTTAIGEIFGHATYKNIWDSIIDRLLWDNFNGIGFYNYTDYINDVVSYGYAEDKDYSAKWKLTYISHRLVNVKNIAGLLIIFFISLSMFLLLYLSVKLRIIGFKK